MPQVWWKVAIVIGVFIIIFCVTAAMLFWDCCKLRSSWKAAVSLRMSWLCGHSNSIEVQHGGFIPADAPG